MKKPFIAIVSAILFCCALQAKAQNDDATLYFSTEEMPDLLRCLPPPPDTVGTDFVNDIMRYMWGKTQRNNPERAAIAFRDSYWEYDSLIKAFNVPFGLEITREGTPEIYRLIINSLSTIDQARVKPKAFYHRKRPYERFHEHMLTVYEEEDLRGNGSYPSGHSQRGYALALLLSEVNPANADTIMARGYLYGESRVIVGAHWESDVEASRLASAIGLSRLHTSPAFLAQLAKAQDEFKRLTGIMSPTDDNSQFVEIAEAIPDVILEIRYYSTYNFVGARVDGYLEPTALLTRQAADSLRAVSDELKAMGYRLKIFDAYRPQCAVDHFVRWAADVADTLMKPYFYPDVPRDSLFELGYIAKKSGHTRGSTVDLTLFDMTTEKEVDMGGTFDWFGNESHPDYMGITREQYHNRMILREAMLRHGFKAIDEEWWHFTLKDEPFPDTYFTFPVKRLEKRY